MSVSIRKIIRGGRTRWEVVADIGPDPATGKRRQRSKTFSTEREAKQFAARWRVELSEGTVVERSKQTVAEMMTYWLETYASAKKPRTFANYTDETNRHIVPYLGSQKIQKLEPRHIVAVDEIDRLGAVLEQ